MKSSKTSNHTRPVAFFLIAVTLIFTIGFAAGGWQSISNNQENSGEVADESNKTDNNNNDIPPKEPEIYIPQYTNYLTGLEVSSEEANKKPIAVIMNSLMPLYGISSADMIIEMPTEGGDTRLLTYISSSSLPLKIGTIAPSRKYIDNMIKYFGGIMVSCGRDDYIQYGGFDISESKLDISQKSEYSYTEHTHYVYTNNSLLNSAISNTGISTDASLQSFPFKFVDFGKENIKGSSSATGIIIPFSEENETEFTYSEKDGKYILSKNGEQKKDLLNDTKIAFDNLFILFADAITYETAQNSEMVLDTVSGGCGLYFTNGTYISIDWSVDDNGNMTFTTKDGQIMIANRGISYIGFMKSSKIDNVKII